MLRYAAIDAAKHEKDKPKAPTAATKNVAAPTTTRARRGRLNILQLDRLRIKKEEKYGKDPESDDDSVDLPPPGTSTNQQPGESDLEYKVRTEFSSYNRSGTANWSTTTGDDPTGLIKYWTSEVSPYSFVRCLIFSSVLVSGRSEQLPHFITHCYGLHPNPGDIRSF